ncbi:MAG: ATP phosphoribosyltransferase regulatory subunit [Planctomycetota bacterium]|nr:ATP phosphoribosyltransferase regulatory subunit [Planctomycetota bacterium]
MSDPAPKQGKPKPVSIQAPKGTRDFYPREMMVRRYITDAWRRTALRHGFDEIDGPTFESAELYAVKSGDGILGEMFGVYSGKSPEDVEAVKQGRPPLGLRPEFTPTLARMYAARARQLPQPTKWFCVSNFFRAERPQRGRLREFWQWNCDVIGGDDPETIDAEVIAVTASMSEDLGLSAEVCKARYSNRTWLDDWLLRTVGVAPASLDNARDLLDRQSKMDEPGFRALAASMGFLPEHADRMLRRADADDALGHVAKLRDALRRAAIDSRCQFDASIVRGLAYYTGTVFELIAEGERAVAGGGRYDNLIELFGGPPTPACGFGMGDAVLGNLLEDRKLIPEGLDMVEALSHPMPVRPDAFVVASGNEGCDALVVPLVAQLRGGVPSEKATQGQCRPWSPDRYAVPPLHARRSYKATRNVGKLLADAGACHARYAVIIEQADTSAPGGARCTLKNLDTREELKDVSLGDIGNKIARG